MGATLHCYTHASGGQILENWGRVELKPCCGGVMVEATTLTDCISHWYWVANLGGGNLQPLNVCLRRTSSHRNLCNAVEITFHFKISS
jgi:hypothetical protein